MPLSISFEITLDDELRWTAATRTVKRSHRLYVPDKHN